ncbi:hypothetical protein A6A20_05550 [Volucribacter amazonae]|uniref:Uncharacterized protein n=1 Tax=Volucribacter amazonae TaxID=256731 RepID=A0A9X4PCG3_9PAST|nr:hypothetical protein [Volucribacter amazonae]
MRLVLNLSIFFKKYRKIFVVNIIDIVLLYSKERRMMKINVMEMSVNIKRGLASLKYYVYKGCFK